MTSRISTGRSGSTDSLSTLLVNSRRDPRSCFLGFLLAPLCVAFSLPGSPAVADSVTTPQAAVRGDTQSATPWQFARQHGYYFREFRFLMPGENGRYGYHYLIWLPKQPDFIWCFSPLQRVYYGRIAVSSGQSVPGKSARLFSYIKEPYRKEAIFPEEAFSEAGDFPLVPGSGANGHPMRFPLDIPEQAQAPLPPPTYSGGRFRSFGGHSDSGGWSGHPFSRGGGWQPGSGWGSREGAFPRFEQSSDNLYLRTAASSQARISERYSVRALPRSPDFQPSPAETQLRDFCDDTREPACRVEITAADGAEGRQSSIDVSRGSEIIALAIAERLEECGVKVGLRLPPSAPVDAALRRKLATFLALRIPQALLKGQLAHFTIDHRTADGMQVSTAALDLEISVRTPKRVWFKKRYGLTHAETGPGLSGRTERGKLAAGKVIGSLLDSLFADESFVNGLCSSLAAERIEFPSIP